MIISYVPLPRYWFCVIVRAHRTCHRSCLHLRALLSLPPIIDFSTSMANSFRTCQSASRFLYLLPILVLACCSIQFSWLRIVTRPLLSANNVKINGTLDSSSPFCWKINEHPNTNEYDISFIMRRIQQLNDCTVSAECHNATALELGSCLCWSGYWEADWAFYDSLPECRVHRKWVSGRPNEPSPVERRGKLWFLIYLLLVGSGLGGCRFRWFGSPIFEELHISTSHSSHVAVKEAIHAHSLLPFKEWGHWTENKITEGLRFDHVLPLGDKNVTRILSGRSWR